MLEKQINNITTIVESIDLQEYPGELFNYLIESTITGNPVTTVKNVIKAQELLFHIPTAIFWGKMRRFLLGTFHDFDEQKRMSSKFKHGTRNYNEFVKKQIEIINQIDDEEKVDYFAQLTRAFLFGCVADKSLYFKLAKFVMICTTDELIFLEECDMEYTSKNNAMISALYQHGLIAQNTDDAGETFYELSGFAKALKQNALNFNELNSEYRLSFNDIEPLPLLEAASDTAFNNAFGEVFMVAPSNTSK